jgi:HEAT repeat protein
MSACQSGSSHKGESSDASPAKAHSGAPDSGDRQLASGPSGRAYHDPVARATLRERALTVLSSAATNGLPEERANAIEGLSATPARLTPLIDQALADPNVGIRSVAAMAAGNARIASTAPRLRAMLADDAPQVRAAAMFGLKRCGESVDLTPLASMLMASSPQVRAQAAFLLGELGERSAVPLLKDAGRAGVSRTDRPHVRVMDLQLAEARVKLGDETALPEIRAALFPASPEDLEATALACQIIGSIHDAPSVNRLIELVRPIDDKKQVMPAEVRLGAASALAKLGQRHGAYIADQYRANKLDPLRAQAAMVYGDVGDVENLPLLVDMMNDPIGRVRVAAAAAIVRITEGAGEGGFTRASP